MIELILRIYERFFGRTSKELIKVFIIQLLIVFCGFLTNIVIARLFGKEELGIFTYFFGLVGLLGIISLFGMQQSIVLVIKRNINTAKIVIFKSLIFTLPFSFLVSYFGLYLADYFQLNPPLINFKIFVYIYVTIQVLYAILSSFFRSFNNFMLSSLFSLFF